MLDDKIEVIVVDLDCGEVVGDVEGDGFFCVFDVYNWFELEFENVFGEKVFEVVFDGFLKVGRWGKRRYVWRRCGWFIYKV